MTEVAVRGAVRVWERSWKIHKFYWRSDVVGSIIQPLLYLMGMGIGVGALVDARNADALGGLSYLAFVAPAIVAAAAMNVGAQESVWPMMDGFKWSNAYRAMCATPLRASDVAAGMLLWHLTKAAIATSGVGLVLLALPATRGWGVLAAVPAGMLTGLAYAMPITAWTATRESDTSFPLILRFIILPTFLFAGVFFPVSQLPAAIGVIAWALPLWHGVELSRGAVTGGLEASRALVHIAILLAWVTAGLLAARWTFTKRLTP
jgi:lipooligosaccharide transport system permease protein